MINVAIPAIGKSLHADLVSLQWVLTGYLLTVASLLLLAGALADHFGRRRILTVGLGLMLVASVVCATAPSVTVLIIARVLQGAGGALVVPSSLALLNGTLRPQDRARGIGIWAGLATISSTVGPYGGGWLCDRALRRLKKKIDREGGLKAVRNHRHFEKPSERRRRKEKVARFSAMLSARYADQ